LGTYAFNHEGVNLILIVILFNEDAYLTFKFISHHGLSLFSLIVISRASAFLELKCQVSQLVKYRQHQVLQDEISHALSPLIKQTESTRLCIL